METNGPSDGPQFEIPTAHPDITNSKTEATAAILAASAAASGASKVVALQIGTTLATPDKPGDYED